MDSPRIYFDALFGDAVDDDNLISIFALPARHASFHATVDAACDAVAKLLERGDQNVYSGVGLYRPGIRKGRGRAADVTAITSVWADLDHGSPSTKGTIPPDRAAVADVIAAIGVPASMTVSSGHGIHAYWLLKEPLTAEDDMGTLARLWGETVVARALSLGFTVDQVGDLPRVLRVPGTFNLKCGEPIPVEIEEFGLGSWVRRGTFNLKCGEPIPVEIEEFATRPILYDWDHLEQSLVRTPGAAAQNAGDLPARKSTLIGELVLSADLTPDGLLLEQSLDNDPRFKRTWLRRRQDLADQSPSSYDMAIAHWGAQCELPDQTIADFIVAWRRKHGFDLEKVIGRADYIPRTIRTAREAIVCQTSDKAAVAERAASKQFPGQSDRRKTIDSLRAMLGIPVARIIRRGRRDARYALVLDDGHEIPIGPAGALLSPERFRVAICDSVGKVLKRWRHDAWVTVCQAMVEIAEQEDLPDSDDRIRSWLSEYVSDRPPHDESNWQVAPAARQPYIKDGLFAFSMEDFLTWVRATTSDRVDSQDIRCAVKACGYEGNRITATHNGIKTGRYYYVGRVPD